MQSLTSLSQLKQMNFSHVGQFTLGTPIWDWIVSLQTGHVLSITLRFPQVQN